jgi:trans-aconitate 2-methyltransferase
MNSTSKYTFGDSDQAAERLSLLAGMYESATRDLLLARAPRGVEHAVDLGCGPGYTTRLLHEVLAPRHTTGIDSSERYIEQARQWESPELSFMLHDVLQPPFPVPPANLMFCRHLLTHIADLRGALLAFRELGAPGAYLVIQENETLAASDPTLARYYECVSALQAAHGQRTHVGARLNAVCAESPFRVEHSALRVLAQPAASMARLHRMNLSTWRLNERASALFEPAELDSLDERLARIESGDVSAQPVENALRELVLRLP